MTLDIASDLGHRHWAKANKSQNQITGKADKVRRLSKNHYVRNLIRDSTTEKKEPINGHASDMRQSF